ncbi:MAG: energy-coupling factor ABC transporter permease [Ignavibacteriales bacterium]|nr:energy-coupling factor ABC transporter permease [Ignavibacteriales bacterium]
MHIPDGFLDTKTVITTATLSTVGISFAFRHLKNSAISQQVPLIGLSAAFVFVAQMLNFPIAAGTSGHFMGTGLITMLLGPSAAIIIMTVVLGVQCFLFTDGGLISLGANIFNMAIGGALISYAIQKVIEKILPDIRGKLIATGISSWSATVLASILCAGELAWSMTVSWSAAFTAMANIHMLIGIAEGAIATIVVAGILKSRPEIIRNSNLQQQKPSFSTKLIYVSIIVIGIMIFITPFITELPDGLEKVASVLGFDHKAIEQPILNAPFPDYQLGIFSSPALATIAAGFIGITIVFILSFILSKALTTKKS